MKTYFVIILIVILLFFLSKKRIEFDGTRGFASLLEGFETSKSNEYYYIQTKLNKKVVQPYKGTIDSSLTMNERRENYYPQLWTFQDNYLQSVYNKKYLTISSDGTKVELSNLDSNKQQKWKLNDDGTLVNLNKESQALTIEGSNTSEDAMVSIDKPQDKPSFKWELIKVEIEIKRVELVKGEISGKVEKEISGSPIISSNGFSYSLWFIVNNNEFNRDKWRNLFLRGTKDESQRTPGIWLVPNKNKLHVRASTDKNANDGIWESKFTFEPETWYYITYVISDNKLQLYINGQISEEYTFSGSPIHKGEIYIANRNGFDGKIAHLEYVNKPLVSNEIIENMKRTNPDKDCGETREITIVSNNIVKSVNEWKMTGGEKIKNNKQCPPNKLGGPTLTFNVPKESKIETKAELLENQYYDVSIWGLGTREVNIRPISGNWKGEWQLLRKEWKQLTWEFLNVEKSSDFAFELNTESSSGSSVTLFLPVVKVKLLRVEDGNIQVKQYRSNGTHPTCTIKDVGLNSILGWCALKDVRDKYYLEASFDKLYQIQKIHTRGRGDYPQWTTEYKVEYYDIYFNSWKSYANGIVLQGNKDMNTLKTNDVNIVTEKIRIYPVSYHSWPSMRLGFSGVVAVKDKCMEYKTKSEIEQNILEREKYLKMYNKECKKISYYEHEIELEREKKLLDNLEQKLKKSEINAKTYESKYNESTTKIRELEKRIEKLNLEKEIIGGNNRDMDKSTKLNEKCEPIKDNEKKDESKKEESKKDKSVEKKDDKTVEKKKKTKDEMLQELLEKMDKVTKDLEVKQTKLEKIESELKLLENKSASTENKKAEKKLVKKKRVTQKDIDDLKEQLKTCQANFEGNSVVETFVSEDASSKSSNSNVITCSVNKYDIRKHRQYKKLISDIENKMKSEYKCEKKEQCKPFDSMDIKKHKDYPKVVEAVYAIARNEFSDITKHRDYKKMVHEVERRTMAAYGRKTPNGYAKCPTECELMNEIDINKHPKFRAIIREVVRKVIAKYGQPIPGTNPVLYRPCSEKIVSSNIKDMSTDKCIQSYNFANVEKFENYQPNADIFDIRNHKQFPELMKAIEQKKCGDAVPNVKIEELKRQCETQIKRVRADVTKSEPYQKLLLAYEKLVKEQKSSDNTGGKNFEKLQKAYQKLKKEYEAIKLNGAIGTFDITRHPDIDRYVLKSSLPIDLNVKKTYDDQIALLKAELAKLQSVHGKCTTKFNVATIEGFTSNTDTNEAKVLVEKINKLLAKLDKNLSVEDKGQFEEIKNACRNAFNFVGYMDDKSRKFVENVYRDILAVQAKEKKLEDLLNQHLRQSQQVQTTPQLELSKMIQLEVNKKANDNQLLAQMKEIDLMKNSLESSKSGVTSDLLVKSKEAIEDVASKLGSGTVESPKQEAEYLRNIRKELESQKDTLDVNVYDLKKKYDKLKATVQDYEFKNKYIRDELSVLRKRCNERIMKLWEENGSIRKSLEDREIKNKDRELNLERKQKELEEREEKLSNLRSSQLEKYSYFQNKLKDERTVADKYKAELERLRDNLEKEKTIWDSKRLELESEVSKVRDECSNRVDRYRRMYEEGEKLLEELRTRSLQAPKLVEKIDQVSNKMAQTVDKAITKTEELKVSSVPTMNAQVSIDNQLIDGMKKLADKVSDIENKLKTQKATSSENAMWYNNKYAVI